MCCGCICSHFKHIAIDQIQVRLGIFKYPAHYGKDVRTDDCFAFMMPSPPRRLGSLRLNWDVPSPSRPGAMHLLMQFHSQNDQLKTRDLRHAFRNLVQIAYLYVQTLTVFVYRV